MSRARSILVGLAVLSASAASATSASATSLHWFVNGEESAASVRTNVTSKGGVFILKTKAHGIKIEIKCNKESGSGWIENPVGGGNGIDLLTSEFKECEVIRPSGLGCTVNQPITPKANTELVTIGEAPWDKFTPDPAGGPFVVITIANCTGSASVLNGSYNIEGKTNGKVENSTSQLKFSATENDELTFAGESTTLEGASELRAEGGGTVGAGPPSTEFKGPSWSFEGSRLGAGEEKSVTTSGGTFKIRSISGEVKIECSGASGSGDIIGSAASKVGTDHHNKLEFTGCVDKAEAGCEIVSFANGEKEERTAGKIGPVSVATELVFPGNTLNRVAAGDLFLPLEENTEAKFGAGAPETVFVVVELKKKGSETCAPNGKRFSLLAAPAGGPAAELKISKKSAKSGEQAEAVELIFPATQFEHVEKWTGSAYKIEPVEFQWINQSKELQTLEIEGTLTLKMTGKKFGWTAS
jgi:hypothetical protein